MIEQSSSNQQSQHNVKQKCLYDILKLSHYREMYTSTSSSLHRHEDKVACSEEDGLRLFVRSLLPLNIKSTISSLTSQGRLHDVVLLLQRCVTADIVLNYVSLLRLIPDDVDPVELIRLIRDGLIPRLSNICSRASMHDLLAISSELLTRARDSESRSGSPFAAIKLLDLALEICTVIPDSLLQASQLVDKIAHLRANLLIQRAVWDQWSDHLRLEEVLSLGLKGLVFDRIDSTDETEIVSDYSLNIIPLIAQFNQLNADELLKDWILESIATRIVIAGDDDDPDRDLAQDIDVHETCTFSRLVTVASLISDRNVQAKMVLKLLQMPVLEELSSIASNDIDDDDNDSEFAYPKSSFGRTRHGSSTRVFHVESTRLLCDLAVRAYDQVDGGTRDALIEATRLLRIKSIAASYGVTVFEPRNSRQVRAVVSIIANSVHKSSSIMDAVEFASSCGNCSLDINAVLTRALILRATNSTLHGTDSTAFEHSIKATMEALPVVRKHVIIEDALLYLLGDLEERTDSIEYDPDHTSRVKQSEEKRLVEMVLQSATLLSAHYIDSLRGNGDNLSSNSSKPSSGAKYARTTTAGAAVQSPYSFWVNSCLVSKLKRLHGLQSHGVYLSVADLDNKEVCRATVMRLAKHRVQLLLREVRTRLDSASQGMQLSSSSSSSSMGAAPLNSSCRKVCLLLDECSTLFIHTAMKLLVDASETVRHRRSCDVAVVPSYLLVGAHSYLLFRHGASRT